MLLQGPLFPWVSHGPGHDFDAAAPADPFEVFQHHDLLELTRRVATGLLITDFAIREFQADHGRPPDRLDELVPHYVGQVPLDPFFRDPLVYCRQGDSYLLYSVGPNRVDEGGKVVVTPEELVKGPGDISLEMFDAAASREPPKPPDGRGVE